MADAYFYDGKTAIKHNVQLSFGDDALAILGDEGAVFPQWLYENVVFVDQMSGGGTARFSYRSQPDARLVIEDRSALAILTEKAPALFPNRRRKAKGVAVWAAVGLASLVAAYFGLGALADRAANWVPVSWVEPLGRQAAEQLASFFSEETGARKFCTAYDDETPVSEIVRHLSAGVREDHNFSVKVVRSKAVNAFAVPGGYIMVFDGLLKEAETVEEIAGVIAHEMGHVIARHPTAGVIKHFGVSMVIGALIGNETIATAAGTLVAFSYSRKAEEEADRIAVELLQKAGYGTEGLASFFSRLAEREKKGFSLPTMLSTHPSSEKRAGRLKTAIPPMGKSIPSTPLKAMKNLC